MEQILYGARLASSYQQRTHQPDPTTLRTEHKALQLLTNGPFNAIPKHLLYTLKQIGLPTQADSLRTTSLASRTRTALHRNHLPRKHTTT
jgi:hypothetical protein